MLHKKITRLVAIVTLLSSTSVLAVQFDNRSFEQGSLNGWEYIGDVSVQEAAAFGVTPVHGPHAALLTNSGLGNSTGSYGSTRGVSPQSFLAWLGYPVPNPTPPVGPLAGIEGNSGLRQSVNLRAGDVVSFDWNIFGDGHFDRPFAWFYPAADPHSGGIYTTLDAPYVYTNDMTPWLGKCLNPNEYVTDPNCAYSTGWQSFSVVAPADGDYVLVFGIFNQMDPAWLSALWLDDFKISRVPEPGTLALLGLSLGLASIAVARRTRIGVCRNS